MNPGRLDRIATILAPVVTIDAESGGSIESFRDAGTLWASRADTGGREYRSSGALHAEATSIFTVRFNADLTTRHRLRCEGKEYDILSIGETEGRRKFLAIQARVRLP